MDIATRIDPDHMRVQYHLSMNTDDTWRSERVERLLLLYCARDHLAMWRAHTRRYIIIKCYIYIGGGGGGGLRIIILHNMCTYNIYHVGLYAYQKYTRYKIMCHGSQQSLLWWKEILSVTQCPETNGIVPYSSSY